MTELAEDLEEIGAGDDWAVALVQTSAWHHLAVSYGCLGYTIANSGRALCSRCGWRLSARLEERGTVAIARFALFALASIGQAIADGGEQLRSSSYGLASGQALDGAAR